MLINRQHFKTGILERYENRFSLTPFIYRLPTHSLLYAIPPSPSPPSSLHSGASYYNDSPSLSLGYPRYPPLIRVQSATDDNQLQRRVFSGDPIFRHFVSPSPKLTRGTLPLDPLSPEHDVCGLNYSDGSTRNPGSRFKGSACLAQSLPRRHRLRRSQDLTEGTLLNGRRTRRNDLED